MHIGQRIKEIADLKKISVQTIAHKLGRSKQAVYDIYKKESVKTEQLEQLSEILEMPVTMFFSDDQVILESENFESKYFNPGKYSDLLDKFIELQEKYVIIASENTKFREQCKEKDEEIAQIKNSVKD